MPRLTAVAPLLTSGASDNESTVLATEGGVPLKPTPILGDLGGARKERPDSLDRESLASEAATDPGRPLDRGDAASSSPSTSVEPRRLGRSTGPPSAPVLTPVAADSSPPALAPAPTPLPEDRPATSTRILPGLASISSQITQVGQGNANLIIALAAIVALLIVGIVGVVLLKPSPTGLLMIEVPEEIAKQVVVQINGKIEPVTEFPDIRPVPAGKVTVRLSAPNYETLVETVEVREGGVPATLTSQLRKKLPAGR